jgi:hypothetical protein
MMVLPRSMRSVFFRRPWCLVLVAQLGSVTELSGHLLRLTSNN